MPTFRVGHHDNWPTLGWEVIDWVETYLCHGPGDVEYEPIVLDDEFVQVLLDAYRLYPRDHDRVGQRVCSRFVLSRPKGRAKSELAGVIVCVEAMGPARFDGWKKAGVPVGRPVRSPFIRCLSTEESQVGNTYDNVTTMLEYASEHHPDVFGRIDIGRNRLASTRIYLPSGEIRPSTASSAAKDGGRETFAVADETHRYILRELKEMHRVVSRNLRKRKDAEPWMLDTTTSHLPGEHSVAEGTWERAQELKDHPRRVTGGFCFDHREGSAVEEWSDDDQVLASLREAYGEAAAWLNLDRILTDDIRSPEATEEDSRRFWCNQVWAGSNRAFDVDGWAELRLSRPKPVPKRNLITIGVKGARFNDAVGAIATDVVSGHQWPIGIWERPAALPRDTDYEHPLDEVEGAIAEAFDTWEVWRAYVDPQMIEGLVDGWQGRWGEKRVVKWSINRPRTMAFAIRAYRTAQSAGELTHDGWPMFSAHIANARRNLVNVRDDDGRQLFTIKKEHPTSPLEIAGAIAGVLSWEARGDAVAAGATKRKGRRVRGF